MKTFKHFIILIVLLITFSAASEKVFTQWVSVPTTMTDMWDIHFINNTTGLVAGFSGILRTTNGGTNWNSAFNSEFITGITQVNDSILVTSTYPGKIFRSSNRGANWNNVATFGFTNFYGAIDAFNQTVVIGSTSNSYALSTNGGIFWSKVTIPGVSFIEITGVDLTDENTIYITSTAHGTPNVPRVYKSTNKGTNWTNIYTPSEAAIIAGTTFTDVKFKDANTGFVSSSNGRIARTTNAGANWDIATVSDGKNFRRFQQVGNDSMYLCCSTPHVFHTPDMSLSWIAEITLGNPNASTIAYGANYLWVGGYGVFIRKKMVAKVVISGSVTANGGYDTFADAFNAINSGDQSGSDIIITIEQGTSEPNTGAVLNHGNWNSLKINPGLPISSRTISGTVNGNALIDLNGADKVTIDGVFNGGFIFKNLSTDSSAGTSTVRFRNDASNNYLKNTILAGSSKTNFTDPSATVLFGDGVTTGNDNNVIINCQITDNVNGVYPSCGVYFYNGSSAENNNDTIRDCWIGNYFNSLGSSAGIMIGAGNSGTALISNRFFQSNFRTITPVPGNPVADHYMIRIKNNSGNGFTVKGNVLGYSNPFGTGRYAIESRPNSHVYGIHVQAGISQASKITANTITNIDITGSMLGTNMFAGIVASSGVINIDSNIIGSKTENGSITFASTEWYCSLGGIRNESAYDVVTNNNFVGGISITSPYAYFAGIYGNHFRPWTVNNNIIGSTLPNSIHNQSPGIYSQTVGIISINSGKPSFTNNIIQNMTCEGGEDPSILSIAGIIANSYRYNISGNTIKDLKNNSTSGTAKIAGIIGSNTLDTGAISSNNIHSFSLQNNNASMTGILMRSSLPASIFNNMISLGTGETGSQGYSVCGINDSLGSNNYYYNSIYIGGKPATGNSNSYALRTNSTGSRIFKNNILFNDRSNNGSTGKHYSLGVNSVSSALGMTSDYNDIYSSGSGSYAAFYNGANLVTLNDWKSVSLKDASSISGNPFFKDTTNLYIDSLLNSPVVSTGVPVAGITTDFDGNPRNAVHPFIGADEYYTSPVVSTLNIKIFIQGFYNAAANLQVSDTIKVFLRNSASPFAIVDSAKTVVSDSGKATIEYSGLATGNYFIVVTHRNSLETWSAGAAAIPAGFPISYDFTNSSSQAYGNNLFQSETGVYSDFSGDIIKDGYINLNDVIAVYNDLTTFVTGYTKTDVSGDNLVNLNDLIITSNNASNFISVKRP